MALRYTYKWQDRGWQKLVRKMTGSDRSTHARVGVVGPNAGLEHTDSGITIEEVAVLMEFGSLDGHTRARPYLRPTLIWGNRREILGVLAQVSRRVLFQDVPRVVAMREAGKWAVDKVREKIMSGVKPENAPATIDKKGHGLTLRETYLLLHSISYEIVSFGASVGLGGGDYE